MKFRKALPKKLTRHLFGNNSVNKCTIKRWLAKFRSGNFCLEDEYLGVISLLIVEAENFGNFISKT